MGVRTERVVGRAALVALPLLSSANKADGDQCLVRIFLGESDQFHHTPLARALLARLRREGFARATVIHGVANAYPIR
jgi:hypothetical protein